MVLYFGTSAHDTPLCFFVINTFVQFLGPTAIVTVTIPHTVVAVDITRSGIVPIGVAAKTQREPYGVPFIQPPPLTVRSTPPVVCVAVWLRGFFLCARLAAALLRLQRSLLRLRRDECLGPTAIVTVTIPHTAVADDKTRSRIVPNGEAAKTQREPYLLFVDIREPVTRG